jgi:hypothetical protein
LLIAGAMLFGGRLWGAEAGPDFAKLAPITPCPALVKVAQTNRIPLEKIDPPSEPGRLEAGDSFTALVTLCEKGGHRTQWLLYLEALAGQPKEAAEGKPPRKFVLYSGRGNKLEYTSTRAKVRLRTIGPFAAAGGSAGKLQDHSDSFALEKDFLALGLEQASAKIYQKEQTKAEGHFWFGSNLPNAAQVDEGKKLAEALKLTDADERALGALIPAMLSYFEVVEHTEGLEDILLRVVEKPSLWSVVRHMGVSVDLELDSKHFAPADLTSWGLPASQAAYYFPITLELNHRLALTVTFVVTNPRPPLLACGGVVGMLAERPGDKQTYLTMRVISARCAAGH